MEERKMALSDTLLGTVESKIDIRFARTNSNSLDGEDVIAFNKVLSLTNGSGSNQASGGFSSSFTATTGGISISLADSADPLGAAGDDVPTSSPEGLKLKAIFIENQDATNFVRVKGGVNADTNILTGSTDSINITAGGFFLWTSPAGVSAMNDGVDDELLITANSASCTVKIIYLYG